MHLVAISLALSYGLTNNIAKLFCLLISEQDFKGYFAVVNDSIALDLPEALVAERCENVAIALVFVETVGINSSCKVPQLEQEKDFPYICGKSSPQLLQTYRLFVFAIIQIYFI